MTVEELINDAKKEEQDRVAVSVVTCKNVGAKGCDHQLVGKVAYPENVVKKLSLNLYFFLAKYLPRRNNGRRAIVCRSGNLIRKYKEEAAWIKISTVGPWI